LTLKDFLHTLAVFMSTRFFTNHGEQTLFKKFQGVFESNPDIEWFDALVGYLRSSGYFALRPYLEKVPHIRILVGINVDAIMADYHRRGLLFLADPTKALDEFRNWLRNDIQSAEYRRDIESGILQFVDDVISKKIALRAHPTKRLHAKLYIFRPRGFNEHKPGAVITGSSNLTAAGIGVEEQVSNYEFNVLLHDFDDVQFATDEFKRLWEESVEILPKFLKEVRDSTYLAAAVTPYELYYKLLLEYFGQSIEYDPNALTDMPEPAVRHRAQSGEVQDYLKPFRAFLEVRSQFKKTQLEAGLEWFEFREYHRRALQRQLTYADIGTHLHILFSEGDRVFNQHAPVIELPRKSSEDDCHLVSGLLNSPTALFWLKQMCFSKRESEEGAKDTYFEFAGNKIEQTPVPPTVADTLRGKPEALADRLTALSRACWERGRELPSLALRKLFEKSGEAYHAWNALLPGHVPPHAQLPAPFTTAAELRNAFTQACAMREKLRAEMIALQEEMDWLVYQAYGLLDCGGKSDATPLSQGNIAAKSAVAADALPAHSILPLAESERPFRFWAAADGDFDKAVALIPSDWSAERKELWQGRLAAIRDNEHIRRIEAPVYKRRWDEQWKVSNRWLAGPAAYAQELVDAFRWWLAEKAEWHLEHKAKGGPLSLDAWSIALASDARVQAAWPVIAEAIQQVEQWKIESNDKKSAKPPKVDASSAALVRFFRDTVNDETVPDGIPPAVPWEELEKKMRVPKQAKNVRGKLNVPRERFRLRESGYFWAGK
jgi:PLD-like domain